MKTPLPIERTIEKLLPYIFLVLISLPAVLPLTKSGLFTSHDAEGHVVRLSEFHDALTDGQFPVRWAKRLDNGAGYPFFNFNYPLPYYLAEIPHLLGMNLVNSVKLTFLLTFIASGFSIYLFLKNKVNKSWAILGSVLYLYAPYRFIDMYVRGALAEHLSFVFLPLVFLAIDRAMEKPTSKNQGFGGLSFAAIILSHNIMAMVFLPISILYLITKSKLDAKKVKAGMAPILLGIILSAYFWLPMIIDKKYTNLDFFMQKEYQTNFLNTQNLLYSKWGFGSFRVDGTQGSMSLQFGIAQWLSLFVSILLIAISFRKKNVTRDSVFFLSLVISSLFLTTYLSKPLWDFLPLIRLIQFPWRLLEVTVFATPVLLVILLARTRLPKIPKELLVIFFITLTLYSNRNHARTNANFMWQDWWRNTRGYNGTTTMTNEHRPIWLKSTPVLPYVSGAIIMGNGVSEEITWRSNYHEFEINATTEILFQDRTAYFPGWHTYIDGQETQIDYLSEKSGGFLTISIPGGKHKVVSKFTETPVRLFADIISLISISYIMLWFVSKVFFIKKN